MSDFSYLKDSSTGKWVILAPNRFYRPKESDNSEPICPFENDDMQPLFEQGEVRVYKNIYPFAPIHEMIVHSREHGKDFDELSEGGVKEVFKVFQKRYLEHKESGQVYIFNNTGRGAGESLPHPHTQLVVIPKEVKLEIPALHLVDEEAMELSEFYIFCPKSSSWPAEVWVAPKREGRNFGDATPEEVAQLASIHRRIVNILEVYLGERFPFNFYIYPGTGWYLRIIPRVKQLGGFEVGTGVFINGKDPKEVFKYIKENY
jgi:UDPglucose--hexose-1-phosphate uridylyltransferase